MNNATVEEYNAYYTKNPNLWAEAAPRGKDDR